MKNRVRELRKNQKLIQEELAELIGISRVAHKLRDEEIVEICKLADFEVTKSELGAVFRNENHKNYMKCGDQLLRNFLNGLITHLRGPRE